MNINDFMNQTMQDVRVQQLEQRALDSIMNQTVITEFDVFFLMSRHA